MATKPASKKKTPAKSAAGSRAKRAAPATAAEAREKAGAEFETGRRIGSVVLLALGVLLLAILVIPGSAAWEALGDFFFSLFGFASWLLCVLLGYTAFLMALDVRSKHISAKVWQMLVLALFICALFYTVKVGENETGYWVSLTEAWKTGSGWSGGLLGALIGWPLCKLGKGPAIAVEIIAALAMFFIMSGKGIINVVDAVRSLREKSAERRERRAAYDEEKDKEQQDKGTGEVPVTIGGYVVPAEATARSRMSKDKTKDKFNTDVPYVDTDTTAGKQLPIPIQDYNGAANPPAKKPADSRQGLDAAISDINAPFDPDLPAAPQKGDGAAEFPGLADAIGIPHADLTGERIDADRKTEIEAMAGKASAEVAAQDAKTATTSVYNPIKDIQYKSPPIDLLTAPEFRNPSVLNEELRATAANLVEVLQSFNVEARVINICCGPAVTRYELQPSAGVKISRITNLSNDIALALAAQSVRIEAPIPGKAAIGIEIPNRTVSTVNIREVMESDSFWSSKSKLSVALGKDITGNVIVADLARMPHLMIAGSTGSGKSVCINSFLLSLIYRTTPQEVRLLLIDPKVVELNVYNGIPHLLIPVVTDAKKAAGALAWAVSEMLDRYKLFAEHSVRDLTGYNEYAKHHSDIEPLPQIVIFIDELSDMMMAARSDVEDSICRLAQMARAAGMHLVLATQRPSTDVITGLIKANIPSRIAFAVSSQVDSRVILDGAGAEKLLGRGDMLFSPIGLPKPIRVQGCYVSDGEVERVIEYVKKNFEVAYDSDIEKQIEDNVARKNADRDGLGGDGGNGGNNPADDMLTAAIDCVVEAKKASTSLLQRKLGIGYGRAAKIMDELEEMGIIGMQDGAKAREVLITRDTWYEMKMRRMDD